MCRFCDGCKCQDEVLASELNGAFALLMRSKLNVRPPGWNRNDVVLTAYTADLGCCNYRPKFCPECGRKLRDDTEETA